MNTPTSSYTTSSRPLVLLTPDQSTRISINVPSSQQIWTSAEVTRDQFHDLLIAKQTAGSLIGFDAIPKDEDLSQEEQDRIGLDETREKQLVLLSYFIEHLSAAISPEVSTTPFDAQVLLSAFNHFSVHHLNSGATDVHSLAAPLGAEIRNLVIRSYFATKAKLIEIGSRASLPAEAESLLLKEAKDGSAQVYALFGGQGMNEVYFDELQTLYDLYTPLLTPFLTLASAHLASLAAPYTTSQLFLSGLSPLSWLKAPATRPSVPYLASCAISLPLIGLTQLCQYVVYGLASSLGPHELGQVFKGATGHSQGVVSACVIASTYAPLKDADSLEESWKQFYAKALDGLTILFQIGYQGSVAFPSLAISPSLSESSVENGEGVPTPMLAVTGLELAKLEKKIKEVNAFVDGGDIRVSLHNGLKAFVVTGKPKDLVGLADGLRKGRAPSGKDQSKIPHSKRLPVFSMRFLPIYVPYHSPLLTSCPELALAATPETLVKSFTSSSLSLPVFHTETGESLTTSTIPLVQSLYEQIFVHPIQWATAATNFPATATHAIDFGTGGSSGIGSLCVRNWEGRGIKTFMIGNRASGSVWSTVTLAKEDKWAEKWGPKLVKTADGRVRIDTKMSRLLRKAPLMVAGMTPSTVKGGFVSAVLKAGYHIELAGGGHYNEKAVRAKVDEIQKLVGIPGVGITLNSLYINQRQWTFQLPLWCQMAKEGLPIEGLCVAAGIPSTEKAKEIISQLEEAGIRHVSFKPGSVDGIRQVINIAAAHPNFPIILQWTGGRAGGHHSCEDVHAPILATYASIRSKSNIVLVAGSGFGGAEDTYPYLTGEWSEKFGVMRMPFDGFLFASRVMVAKEAHTSESVKQLIVDAKGVEDSQWEQTYDKPTGGIMTVTSELGEPIHKVATRGVKLWGEFDKTVFALPREKQVAWLNSHKQYVIDRLNADFQKPWFAAKADGKTCDLDDMTYAEVNARLVRLMYVAHENRWVDLSLRNLVGDWLRRVEERLSNVNEGSVKVSALQSYSELDKPQEFLERFLKAYPAAKDQILASADVAYFLAITQRPGQKPVPFIPVLDASFSIWFKKDSLWQAEDIEAVFDQDPQRVCILQGPIAVKYCTTTQQPIGDLLGGIEADLTAKLLRDYYGNDTSKIPSTAYLAPEPLPVDSDALLVKNHIKHSVESLSTGGQKHIYDINGVLPETGEWLSTLAGPKLGWLQAFLTNVSITHGEQTLPNPVKRVLAPRHGQRVELSIGKDGQPEKLDVFGGL